MRNFINRQFFNFGFRFILWSGFFKEISVFGGEEVDAVFFAKDDVALDEAINNFIENKNETAI